MSTQKFAAFFRKCILEMETHVRENRIETICYSMPKHLSTGVEKIDGKLIELGLLELPYPIKSEVTSIVKQLNEIEDIDDISEQEKDYLVSRIINKYEGSPDVVIFLTKYSKHQFTKKYYSITYTQPKQATPVRSLPFGEERRALLHQRFKEFMGLGTSV